MDRIIKKELSYTSLTIRITHIGEDFHILLSGGDKPHVGCTVLAVPRPSLKKDGKISTTSSVLNVTGHKDEALCRLLAERVASKTNAVAVCTGGFHTDAITDIQIAEAIEAVKTIDLKL